MSRFLKRRYIYVAIVLLLIGLLAQSAFVFTARKGSVSNQTSSNQRQGLSNFANLPLRFEQNVGQTDKQVQYVARGAGYTLYLTADGAVMSVAQASNEASHDRSQALFHVPQPDDIASVQMKLVGANRDAQVLAGAQLATTSNYFLGKASYTNVANYSRVSYEAVYPGVDLAWYGKQGRVEYDFNVAAGADASQIRLAFKGADKVSLEAGELLLHTAAGVMRQPAPHIYQAGREISGGYALLPNNQIGFSLAAYDHTQPLVIDPVLDFSTYLGGSGDETGTISAIGGGVAVVNKSGEVWVAGHSTSLDFPIINAIQSTNQGAFDVTLTRLSADDSTILSSTYIGGYGNDYVYGMAIDSSDNVYLTGHTESANFPGLTNGGEVFALKVNFTGSALLYSVGFGASGFGYSIAVDAAGHAYVAGYVNSSSLITRNPIQSYNAGSWDAFAAEIYADGSDFVYSTYLGGSSEDYAISMAVDVDGAAYVAGWTRSTDYPVHNPYQANNAGDADSFVSKIAPGGGSLVFSTYLGGSGNDYNRGIAVDANNNMYLSGSTSSQDYPTHAAFQSQYGGGALDSFVTELDKDDTQLLYSTYVGGSDSDRGNAIALGKDGYIYVAGQTGSTNFPLKDTVQPTYGGGTFDGYALTLNPNDASLGYSTYLGGSGEDIATSIFVDGDNSAYIAGGASPGFPIVNAVQPNFGGGPYDGFVTKLRQSEGVPTPIPTPIKTDCGNAFADLYGNAFYSEILDLYCRGVVNGTSSTTFSPNALATRAQISKILVRAYGIPNNIPSGNSHTFTDVPRDNFAFSFIESGYAAGMISGYDAAGCIQAGATAPCYMPNRNVSRAQLTTLAVKAKGYTLLNPNTASFSDVPTSHWAYRYIETAHAHNVANGYGNGSFRPNEAIHRDAMCGIVDRALNNQ